MNALECHSELVLRERRGELAPNELPLLEAHLAQCASCRLTQRLGADFEECATLEAEDGARISSLSLLAHSWASQRRGTAHGSAARGFFRARSRVALALAAACTLLIAAGASGAFGVWKPHRVTQLAVSPPAPLGAPTSAARTPRTVPVPVEAVAVAPPVVEPAHAVAKKDASESGETAGELLEHANRARRSGDSAGAITLFRELGRRFPGSPEARLAEVRLGGLLLDRGQPRAALAEFDRHLGRGGSLAPEALYGRARALGALGDAGAEREAWTTLARDYPASPYVGFAERRLRALNGEAASTK